MRQFEAIILMTKSDVIGNDIKIMKIIDFYVILIAGGKNSLNMERGR